MQNWLFILNTLHLDMSLPFLLDNNFPSSRRACQARQILIETAHYTEIVAHAACIKHGTTLSGYPLLRDNPLLSGHLVKSPKIHNVHGQKLEVVENRMQQCCGATFLNVGNNIVRHCYT